MLFGELIPDPVIRTFVGFRLVIDCIFHLPAVEIVVEDDGIGISKEDQEKIWRRFYQADPSRKGGSGLGLGLSMVKQIVELHGGSAEVESEPGRGSIFTIKLTGGDRK